MLLSERNGNKKITVYAETKLHFAHPILKTTIKKEFKMKNTNMIKITVITALLVLALSISAQAGTENPICGTWTFSEYQEKISFYEDGTGMMNEKIVFNWRSGKGYIESVLGENFSIYEPASYAYTLSNSGNELKLTDLDDVYMMETMNLVRYH